MCMDDIQVFAKNKKGLVTLIQIIIYSQDIEMEFGIEKTSYSLRRVGKERQWKG